MSEETTRELPDNRSFEERVFARFDAMDARFDAMEARFESRFAAIDARFDKLESRFDALEARVETRFNAVDARLDRVEIRVQALESKALDTKPIWEQALVAIVEVKERVENIERKFDVLTLDMMQLRGDQRRVEKRMDALESHPQ
jgi:tetrahydromethanopterin S-methyltransferase subunit G